MFPVPPPPGLMSRAKRATVVLFGTITGTGPSLACLGIGALSFLVYAARVWRKGRKEASVRDWGFVAAALPVACVVALVAAMLHRVLFTIAYAVPAMYFLLFMIRNWSDLWSVVGAFFRSVSGIV